MPDTNFFITESPIMPADPSSTSPSTKDSLHMYPETPKVSIPPSHSVNPQHHFQKLKSSTLPRSTILDLIIFRNAPRDVRDYRVADWQNFISYLNSHITIQRHLQKTHDIDNTITHMTNTSSAHRGYLRNASTQKQPHTTVAKAYQTGSIWREKIVETCRVSFVDAQNDWTDTLAASQHS